MEIKMTKWKEKQKRKEEFKEKLETKVENAFEILYKIIRKGEEYIDNEENLKWRDVESLVKAFAVFFNSVYKLYGDAKPEIYIDNRKLIIQAGDEKITWEISPKPDENRFLIKEIIENSVENLVENSVENFVENFVKKENEIEVGESND